MARTLSHFSSRTTVGEANRLSQLRAQFAGPLLDLTVSNPTTALSDYPHDAIRQALCQVRDFRYQPEPFGPRAARSLLGSRIGKPAEQIVLTSSTSEAYSWLLQLLCEPGDAILTPVPSYPLFEHLAALAAVEIIPYFLRYDGDWHIDFDHLASLINNRTRAIVVVDPNNPTGNRLRTHEVGQLHDIAALHGMAIIADEVFAPYLFESAAGRLGATNWEGEALLFRLDGLSKSAGMPQMKLAWMTVEGPVAVVKAALARLELIADTFLPVSSPAVSALPDMLPVGDEICATIRARLRRNLDKLDQVVNGTELTRLTADGGWSAIVQLPRTRSEEDWIVTLLERGKVWAQPGFFYDMQSEAFVVLSLLTEEQPFAQGIHSIVNVVRTSAA